MSVENITLNDLSRITTEIPAPVRVAIADVVIAFSRCEAAAEELIWVLCGLSFEDGSLLTAMDARPKFALAKQLVGRRKLRLSNPELPATFWETVDDLRTYRNTIAHGQWMIVDGTIPAVGSFRKRDQQGRRVVADAFSIERLQAIANQCNNVAAYFGRLIETFAGDASARAAGQD